MNKKIEALYTERKAYDIGEDVKFEQNLYDKAKTYEEKVSICENRLSTWLSRGLTRYLRIIIKIRFLLFSNCLFLLP
jgi:hypothetical protein